MPTWIGEFNGNWGSAARWSGGVPNAIGAVAEFAFTGNGGTVLIDSTDPTLTLGTLNITTTGTTGWALTSGNLIFNNGASPAQLNVTQISGANPVNFAPTTMVLTNNLIANITGTALFLAPVSGSGSITKTGTGTLQLTNPGNTFSGGLNVQGGLLDAAGDGALGSGAIALSGSAAFRSSGAIDNSFSVDAVGEAGIFLAATGNTMTLTGALSHNAFSRMSFGSVGGPGNSGTIIASFSSISRTGAPVGYLTSIIIRDGTTLALGSAYAAANLFVQTNTDSLGMTVIAFDAILDTRGFLTTISNLSFSDGTTIQSTIGSLNVVVNGVRTGGLNFSGEIEGTTGLDQFIINMFDNGVNDFDISSVSFSGWISGADIIRVNGSVAGDVIRGSIISDQIFGMDGNDTIYENGAFAGGADTIDGGNGNDTIFISSPGSGSFVAGGSGTDTLSLDGAVSLGSLSGLEVLWFTGPAASLTLTASQFTNGLASGSSLNGSGTLTVNMSAGDSELYLQTLVGISTVTVFAIGTTFDDVIKGVPLSPNTINAGDGFDLIRGGRLSDILNGGNGNDKIEGGQGADILTGGAGADVFRYQSVLAAGLGAAADQITDFIVGTDKLGFALIDADPLTPGDQAFAFLGTAEFSASGTGEIRYKDTGGGLSVYVDVDGDGSEDMTIILQGLAGQTLTPGDFNL